ncbi:hypothetical protein IMG5_094660 [Ichthyophthirius multifiliis]|uniref:Heat shock factor-binding protein 1 n=1 Tax=Ichthyophthirius multifiliis TaxID=5932 RepID=G0QRK7_ICHMU|nr:hypothetical protein IMG5_094660 [Ichthyophthirius multifiliis]EGR32151.1 hypothetical protein IMG5_094660 [Ichthyophthirius multifiliis]|eukprot:XP_004035637.1 hypothetical protein IMG5_094660 [Ichthyophthirius multifiliis]
MNSQFQQQDNYNEDPSSKELNLYVQNLLKQMQDKFEDMSSNIVGRIDEMKNRIDDIEKSVTDLMNDLEVDDVDLNMKK